MACDIQWNIVYYVLLSCLLIDADVNIRGNSETHFSVCQAPMTCTTLEECTSRIHDQPNVRSNIVYNCSKDERNLTKVCCPASLENVTSTRRSVHPSMHLLPNEQCGQISGSRITGGSNASFGQFPWMALLGFRHIDGSLQYHCGGTLINDHYILTAAHCLNTPNSTLTEVRLGEHNLETEQDCTDYCTDPVIDIPVQSAVAHERYNTPYLKNDIALVRLRRNVTRYTDYIQPICLPFGLNVSGSEEKRYTIAGWGKTDYYNSEGSPTLQFANILSTTLADCDPLQAHEVRPLADTQLCAGGDLGKDACKGDSGGPLMDTVQLPSRSTTQTFQVGIVSFGAIPCGAQTTPSVYTRVSAYLDWILDHIEP